MANADAFFQSYDSHIAMNPGYVRIRIWIRIRIQ